MSTMINTLINEYIKYINIHINIKKGYKAGEFKSIQNMQNSKVKVLNFLVVILAICSDSTETKHSLQAATSKWRLRYNCATQSKLFRCYWPPGKGRLYNTDIFSLTEFAVSNYQIK